MSDTLHSVCRWSLRRHLPLDHDKLKCVGHLVSFDYGAENKFMNCSTASGGVPASCKFSSTCSRLLIPINAVLTPGAERTNCIAVCASVGNEPSDSRRSFGRPWATRPWKIEALEMTVTPS